MALYIAGFRSALARTGQLQFELAAKLGISPSRLSAALHGRLSPKEAAALRRRIEAALGLAPGELKPRSGRSLATDLQAHLHASAKSLGEAARVCRRDGCGEAQDSIATAIGGVGLALAAVAGLDPVGEGADASDEQGDEDEEDDDAEDDDAEEASEEPDTDEDEDEDEDDAEEDGNE